MLRYLRLKTVLLAGLLCVLAACAPPPSANSIRGERASLDAQTHQMRPTPAFAGTSTTVGGQAQTYYFDYDDNALNAQAMASIKAQAQYLLANPGKHVRLEGNTDSRGSREYNIALGWRRDQAVQSILLQEGVPPRQIIMVSYGKERPAVSGDNAAAWAKNRRVNLIYEVG